LKRWLLGKKRHSRGGTNARKKGYRINTSIYLRGIVGEELGSFGLEGSSLKGVAGAHRRTPLSCVGETPLYAIRLKKGGGGPATGSNKEKISGGLVTSGQVGKEIRVIYLKGNVVPLRGGNDKKGGKSTRRHFAMVNTMPGLPCC